MALENLTAAALSGFAKLLTGVRPIWRGSQPESRQRIYFANHRSHGDFVLIWASLPEQLPPDRQSPERITGWPAPSAATSSLGYSTAYSLNARSRKQPTRSN